MVWGNDESKDRETYARYVSAVLHIRAIQQSSWAHTGHFGKAETYLLFCEQDARVRPGSAVAFSYLAPVDSLKRQR